MKSSMISTASRRIRAASHGIMAIFLLLLFLVNADLAIVYVRRGLLLCASTIIPSLFPFMVISQLLVAVNFGRILGRPLERPLGRLFGLPPCAVSALLLGFLCGFPVGAKTATSLYKEGQLSREQAERLLAFCNIPGTGFLVSMVGGVLFGSRHFGWFLYISALLSALLCGCVFRKKQSTALAPSPCAKLPSDRALLPEAISSATGAVLSVSAYVVFFSAVVGCLSHGLSSFSLSPALCALLFGIFEISSGANAAAGLGGDGAAALLVGFAVGWSGLSVYCQILSLATEHHLSLRRYFLSKGLQGLLCGAAAWLYASLFPLPTRNITPTFSQGSRYTPFAAAVCVLFLLAVVSRYTYRGRLGKQDLDPKSPERRY